MKATDTGTRSRFAQQVDAYVAWRRDIFRELVRYRSWLNDRHLMTDDLDHRVTQALHTLRDDRITLAFVGEFSRGKTELINALFFARYGTRILPSGAGRTTMCPGELFFDVRENQSYLRLLPIETRLSELSVSSYRKMPEAWTTLPLDPSQPERLRKAFGELAATKVVDVEEAVNMGFHTDNLERSTVNARRVVIPAWRHALISFDHPLLRRGLTIIDTPGLNALGCEPELTFSLLPEAQAVLFLLSAANGVTQTDLDIWNRHIRDLSLREYTGVYAVVNKIDDIWDVLETPATNQQVLTDIMAQVSRHLTVAPEAVIPVSARNGLLAQIGNDASQLRKSNILALESLLSNDIMRRKEMLIQRRVVNDIIGIMHGSRKLLKQRRDNAYEQLQWIASDASDKQLQMDMHADTVRSEQAFYHKRLLLLKTGRKRMEREGHFMLEALSQERLELYQKQAHQSLAQSWTIVGMNSAMDIFFDHLRDDLVQLVERSTAVQNTVDDIYAQYEGQVATAPLDHMRFRPAAFQRELEDLRVKAGSFRRTLKKLLTEHRTTSQRFLNTIVSEGASLYQRALADGTRWVDNALLPIFQNVQERRQMLDDQLLRIKALSHAGSDLDSRRRELMSMLEDIDRQIGEADSMLRTLRRPAPYQQEKKVVPILNGQTDSAQTPAQSAKAPYA
jgi:hypothetical protein